MYLMGQEERKEKKEGYWWVIGGTGMGDWRSIGEILKE